MQLHTYTEQSCGCRMKSQKRRQEKFYQFKFSLVTMLLKQETFDIFRSKTNPDLGKKKHTQTEHDTKKREPTPSLSFEHGFMQVK